jgi:alkyl hydroperoxide reductase subunit AhpC
MFNFLKRKKPGLRIGDIAPDFNAETTQGVVNFHKWMGDSYAMLFSHPKDFTPVCSTELSRTAALKPEFDKRKTKIMGLSVDSVGDHAMWESDIGDVAKHFNGAPLNFPLIADNDKKVAELYGMIHPGELDNLTIRSVFIIGPDKKIKLIMTYPASTGRNFLEILRALDSIQLTADHKVATPVDWKQGDDCIIIPGLSDDEARGIFKDGWNAVKPYLRLVQDPTKK